MLRAERVDLLSAREFAYVVAQERSGAVRDYLMDKGTLLRGAFLDSPNGDVLVVRDFPFLSEDSYAANHKKNVPEEVFDNYNKIAEEDKTKTPEERRILIFQEDEFECYRGRNKVILSNNFGRYDITKFLFEERTESFGDLFDQYSDVLAIQSPKLYASKATSHRVFPIKLSKRGGFKPDSGVSNSIIGVKKRTKSRKERKYIKKHIRGALNVLGIRGLEDNLTRSLDVI